MNRKTPLFDTLNLADLVMPWFMFMMGVSFTFSMNSMIRRGLSKSEIFLKMGMRALKLLLLGLFVINGAGSYKMMRIPGVLQRFFICYVVVGGLHAFLQPNLVGANPKFIDAVFFDGCKDSVRHCGKITEKKTFTNNCSL